MLNNNIDTAKNIVSTASNLLNVDYIDDFFSLFNMQEQNNVIWLSFLKTAISQVLQDYYNSFQGQFQDTKTIFQTSSLDSLYYYSLLENNSLGSSDINRIISIISNNNIINTTKSLNELYIKNTTPLILQQPFALISNFNFDELTIIYLSNAIYGEIINNELITSNDLTKDNTLILLDKWLIIYKLCDVYSAFIGIPSLNNDYKLAYLSRSKYLNEEYTLLQTPIRSRASLGEYNG